MGLWRPDVMWLDDTDRQQALFHVLAAYSMYNTDVGYCQGMSQIAALLLMYFNEEVCFTMYRRPLHYLDSVGRFMFDGWTLAHQRY